VKSKAVVEEIGFTFIVPEPKLASFKFCPQQSKMPPFVNGIHWTWENTRLGYFKE